MAISEARTDITAKQLREEGVARRVTIDEVPPDYEESGEKELLLTTVAPGSRVAKAQARVSGAAFSGRLKFFKGIKVTASPVVYNADGQPEAPVMKGEQAFILDFTGMRSVLRLELLNNKGKFTLVLPWLGTDFSPKSLYPISPSSPGGMALPLPDSVGASVVRFVGVETTKLFIQLAPTGNALKETEMLEHCRIATATHPSNVKASLNGRLPFWTRPGC